MTARPNLPPLPTPFQSFLELERDMIEGYALAAHQGGRDAGLDEAADVCRLLRCRDEFEPEIQDRMLDTAANRIRALKSDAEGGV